MGDGNGRMYVQNWIRRGYAGLGWAELDEAEEGGGTYLPT